MIKGDKMTKYEALLVAPDGAFVTDFKENTIEEVGKDIANTGSKWLFYSYVFIIEAHEGSMIRGERYRDVDSTFLNKRKIVDAPEPFEFMKGWTVGRVVKKIASENAKLKDGEHLWGLYDLIK